MVLRRLRVIRNYNLRRRHRLDVSLTRLPGEPAAAALAPFDKKTRRIVRTLYDGDSLWRFLAITKDVRRRAKRNQATARLFFQHLQDRLENDPTPAVRGHAAEMLASIAGDNSRHLTRTRLEGMIDALGERVRETSTRHPNPNMEPDPDARWRMKQALNYAKGLRKHV